MKVNKFLYVIFVFSLFIPALALSPQSPPVQVKWSYTWTGNGYIFPALGGLHFSNSAILMHDSGSVDGVYAASVDPVTGRLLYRIGPFSEEGMLYGDKVFTAFVSKRLHFFDVPTGRDLGPVPGSENLKRLLILENSEIYMISGDDLIRIDVPGSVPVWTKSLDLINPGRKNNSEFHAQIIGDRLYISYEGDQPGFCVIRRDTGEILWKHDSIYTDNSEVVRKIYRTGINLVLSETMPSTSRAVGMLTLLSPENGEILSRYPAQGSLGLSLEGLNAFFADFSGRIFSVDMRYGRGLWYYSSFNFAEGTIYPDDVSMQVSFFSADSERLYFVASLTNQHNLVALSKKTGETLWRIRPAGLTPVSKDPTGDPRTLTKNGIVYSLWMNNNGQFILLGVDVRSGKEVKRSAPLSGSFSDIVSGPFEFGNAFYAMLGNKLIKFAL